MAVGKTGTSIILAMAGARTATGLTARTRSMAVSLRKACTGFPTTAPWDPNRAVQEAGRALNDLRQQYKDNPDVSRQITDVEREISRLQVGDISSQELQNRLNRVVLPNLEALELQLRREAEKSDGDQVRSGSTDRVPPGYVDAVAEYFRKLSKGK